MWTETTRPEYERAHLRHATDVPDAEWAVIAPLLPADRAPGRRRTTDLREVINAVLHILRAGCPWRMLPRDVPPRSTVRRHFCARRDAGLRQDINHSLVLKARQAVGREAGPAAGVIDSQPVKTTHSGRSGGP